MKVNAKLELDVSPPDLAAALSEDPEAFSRFWFFFAEIVRKNNIDLEPFGEAMAPMHGSIRQHPFAAINDFMRYYVRKDMEKAER